MTRTALIQLVSEQTMQNLLPVLALKPRLLIHLTTSRTADRSHQIREAAHRAGIPVDLENIRMSDMPSIRESARDIARATSIAENAGLTPVVNFTGGTKLMSIGAYQHAQEKGVTSMYVDTDHQHFLDGGTGDSLSSVLGQDLSFQSVSPMLTVDAIAVANGCHTTSSGRDWTPYASLAEYLLQNSAAEADCWESFHGEEGLCPRGQEPRNPRGWCDLATVPIHLPPDVLRLAVATDLLTLRNGEYYLPAPDPELFQKIIASEPDYRPSAECQRVINQLQSTIGFFSGAWWEVAVAGAVKQRPHFHDVRWSVQVGSGDGVPALEEDVLAVHGVQIALFCCKRGGRKARLTPLLEELDARARRVGGRFTRRYLCTYLPPPPAVYTRARELGIQIIRPNNLSALR